MYFRLRDFENFVEAARHKTFSAAARSLGITQPSLSQSIKRFESDLGCSLFYRTKVGIHLTPDGKRTFEEALRIADSMVHLKIDRTSRLFQGRRINIGCHPVVGSYTLPKALSYLQVKAPDFCISIFHGSSRDIQQMVQGGTVDVGVVVNPNRVPDLVVKSVAHDEVFVWRSPSGPKPQKVICNMDIFQTQTILSKWKDHPSEIVHTDSLELVARLTSAGIGYGIIPDRAVSLTHLKLLKESRLPRYKDSICIVHRPEFGRAASEKALLNAITHALA